MAKPGTRGGPTQQGGKPTTLLGVLPTTLGDGPLPALLVFYWFPYQAKGLIYGKIPPVLPPKMAKYTGFPTSFTRFLPPKGTKRRYKMPPKVSKTVKVAESTASIRSRYWPGAGRDAGSPMPVSITGYMGKPYRIGGLTCASIRVIFLVISLWGFTACTFLYQDHTKNR